MGCLKKSATGYHQPISLLVGAGTAGCVLANRLSANPNVTVLLVEAGDTFGAASIIPLISTAMQGTKYDWAFRTTPQKYSSHGLVNNAKHNYASILTEGDEHTSITLCPRLMRHNGQRMDTPEALHVTEVDPQESLLAKVFTEAPRELGQEYLFKPARYTIRNGIRWSSYHAYLRPAFDRPNLTILTSTSVAKVLFDERKRTKGIVVQGGGSEQKQLVTVNAHREVILSAGALHTPQILKLSGIGPKLELQRHGVELVHDSPNVGRNYFDHLNLPLFVSIDVKVSVTVDKVLSVESIVQYLQHGRGVLATTAVAGIGGARGERHGIILFGMGSVDEQALRHVSNMQQDTFRAFFPFYRNASQEGFLFLSTCHQPRSRGAIYLRDRHITSEPFFNPNYLKDRTDIECMAEAIRLAVRTVQTDAFRNIGAQLHWPRIKRCSNFGPPENTHQMPSERYLECILRTSALTGHHPGGTAAIGPDAGAVVDNKLRVNGVQGLRVVDASVFPTPVSGTPNSVVIAVAEKGSDLILKGDN
uniref:Glucose-methanol-choline oxidoreductase N-terminal domain-containing protein n=1 Tax=Anopheles atroparvus TaxID=41427 RepID=A0A182J0V1_ANOAO